MTWKTAQPIVIAAVVVIVPCVLLGAKIVSEANLFMASSMLMVYFLYSIDSKLGKKS